MDAPIELIPADKRLSFYPISRNGFYKLYKESENCFWKVEEVKVGQDPIHYQTKLNDHERIFVDHVLAFFSSFDGLVNMNLAERFYAEIDIPEVRWFYAFQIVIENIHSEMYSVLLDTIIADPVKRKMLVESLDTMPVVTSMSEWAMKWIKDDSTDEKSFARRLVGMLCVEAIFFAGCFCAIYWLGNRGLMPGLCHSNELIARDERNHAVFAAHIYAALSPNRKLNEGEIDEIVTSAVDVACEFIRAALPINLAEMNAGLMCTYIESIANNACGLLGSAPIYKSVNPFPWMEQLNLPNKTNFFERHVSEYQMTSELETGDFEIADRF